MNKSPTHMSDLNTLNLQPAKIGGPPVPRVPDKYSGEPLTQEIINEIRTGRPFKVGFGIQSAIHRSPRGNDCWYCEHQFNVEYIFHEQNGDKLHPSVEWTETIRRKCEWFGIFLKDAPNYPKDGVHDGFNDISPPQEMTLMGSTSPDYLD